MTPLGAARRIGDHADRRIGGNRSNRGGERATLFTKLRHQHREKVFGEGRCMPLDRNAKAPIKTLARARTEKGKHYGIISAKFLAVLDALLWGFHNCHNGRCFPSYETIAERADCARSTVYEAIHALERAGILTWVNRIVRIRKWGPDLLLVGRRTAGVSSGPATPMPSSIRNLLSPKFQTGTAGQELALEMPRVRKPQSDPTNSLHQALSRLGRALKEDKEPRLSGAAKGYPM
jgi:DNA-binding Lrp family transcriptional regulator